MKKIIIGALTAAITVLNVCAADISLDTKAVFDSSYSLLKVSGNAKTGEDINIVVQSYEIESDKLTLDEANTLEAVFNMTTADKDGLYSVSMGLPEVWSEGIYKALVYQGEENKESWFVYTDITPEELDEINSSDASALKAELPNVGINTAFNDKYGTELSNLLVSARPASGYTKEEFLTELTAGIGLCMIKNGEISIEEFVERFSKHLETENSEFEGFSEEVKREAERLVKMQTAGQKVSGFFADCPLIARINKAESVEALQKLIIDNSVKLGINLSAYNAISTDYLKAQVFEKIIGKSYTTLNDIKNSFEAAASSGIILIPGVSGGGGGASGGGSSSGSYGGEYSTDAPVKEAGFPDMDGHWAAEAVKNLASKNIINGFPDGTFMPEKSVTRAEFSKMICLAKNISQGSYGVSFADVSDNAWYSIYVKALSANNIVNGFSDGTFRPEDNISRQDAAVIVWRIIKNSNTESKTVFSDESEIADYAKEAVSKLGGLGIINGYNGYFNPADNITRAEAAKILNSIMNSAN